MKKSALIIGAFTKTEHGFTGKLETLAVKATITLQPNDDKDKDSHPDFIVLHGQEPYDPHSGTQPRGSRRIKELAPFPAR